MRWTVEPAERLVGEVVVPGDKSISHRVLLLAALADGVSTFEGVADGEDVAASAAAMRALGVEVIGVGPATRVVGVGLDGLRASAEPIDCGNSGTTMRLLAGLLAGQPFTTTLTGDDSLLRRPMRWR